MTNLNWKSFGVKKENDSLRFDKINSYVCIPIFFSENIEYGVEIELKGNGGEVSCQIYNNNINGSNNNFNFNFNVCVDDWETYKQKIIINKVFAGQYFLKISRKGNNVVFLRNLKIEFLNSFQELHKEKTVEINKTDRSFVEEKTIAGRNIIKRPFIEEKAIECFGKPKEKFFIISDNDDVLDFYKCQLSQYDACFFNINYFNLKEIIFNNMPTWIHFHIEKNIFNYKFLIDEVREQNYEALVTGYVEEEQLIDCFDSIFVNTYEKYNKMSKLNINVNLWSFDIKNKECVKNLLTVLYLYCPIKDNLPKERLAGPFNKVITIRNSNVFENKYKKTETREIMEIKCDCFDYFVEQSISFAPQLIILYVDSFDQFPWQDLILCFESFLPKTLVMMCFLGDIIEDVVFGRFCRRIERIYVSSQEKKKELINLGVLSVDIFPLPVEDNLDKLLLKIEEHRVSFLKDDVDLTISIGTFNRLKSLKKAISNSFETSGKRKIEIIVNDAGSTDGTQEYLKELSKENENVIAIFSNKRTSFTQSFNEVLQVARGKYITFYSDDFFSNGRTFEKVCDFLDGANPLDFAALYYRCKNEKAYSIRTHEKKRWPVIGVMYVETLKKFGGINEDYLFYSQDSDLTYRIMRAGGKIHAVKDTEITHDEVKDELKSSNFKKHKENNELEKFNLISVRSEETTHFFPSILLIGATKNNEEKTLFMIDLIKKRYLNSFIFLEHKIKSKFKLYFVKERKSIFSNKYDIIIDVNKNIICSPGFKNIVSDEIEKMSFISEKKEKDEEDINFCVCFDSNYLEKGLVCCDSLLEYCPEAKIYVLCLDEKTIQIMDSRPNVVIVYLEDLENLFPDLLKIKKKRELKEYYATLSPVLPLYLFKKFNLKSVFYTDADICFFSSVREIKEIFSDYSIMITSHENPKAFAAGIFNVGILGYRNDENCKEFLNWWYERCLEWCHWFKEGKKFADQGYLDVFYDDSLKFKNFHICNHHGINLGPWNVGLHNIYEQNNCIKMDFDKNVICYHFHGYKEENGEGKNATGWDVNDKVLKTIYKKYFERIQIMKKNNLQTNVLFKENTRVGNFAKEYRKNKNIRPEILISKIPKKRNVDENKEIFLFSPFYIEETNQRNNEILTCIIKNISNKEISKIFLFSEVEEIPREILSEKIEVVESKDWTTYNKIISFINSQEKFKNSYNVIVNSDIYFDMTLSEIKKYDITNSCVALGVWKNDILLHPDTSQGAWIFDGHIIDFQYILPMGTPGCENRFLFELKEKKYNLYNLCHDIKVVHLHKSMNRKYDPVLNRIPKPYVFLHPYKR